MRWKGWLSAVAVVAFAAAGCGGGQAPPPSPTTSPSAPPPGGTAPPAPGGTEPSPAPEWDVGASPLPLRPDGYGRMLPTPEPLVVRTLPTQNRLPPPPGAEYVADIRPVPNGVLARSTWSPECPVGRGDLRYLTMSFWGFDGRNHTGEMLVNARYAEDVVRVFRELHAQHYPIEEMRVVSDADVNKPPTGDGNNTSAFVCRATRGQQSWSEHAYGRAIDVNPFINPYIGENGIVLPELASAYLNREWVRPGMILPGDPVVRAFGKIGWEWGGEWTAPRDLQHFSATGR